MIPKDKSLPYPYLPGYTGTYADRQKEFKRRVERLLEYLTLLETKLSQNKNDTSLLADVEACHCLVMGMLEE